MSESRIRIAFDQSLELQSFASSIRSATAGAIGEEYRENEWNGREEENGSEVVCVLNMLCVSPLLVVWATRLRKGKAGVEKGKWVGRRFS